MDLSVSRASLQASRVGLAKHTDDKYILNVSGSFRGKRWPQSTIPKNNIHLPKDTKEFDLGGILISLAQVLEPRTSHEPQDVKGNRHSFSTVFSRLTEILLSARITPSF